MATTVEAARKLGLTENEFLQIQEILGRVPNFTELAAYSVMWSEHCSYKNSIKWLKTLPRDGKRLLVKAGEENAGLVDIGDGLGVVFKIESHNTLLQLNLFKVLLQVLAVSIVIFLLWGLGQLQLLTLCVSET